jgi:hypothetical protein
MDTIDFRGNIIIVFSTRGAAFQAMGSNLITATKSSTPRQRFDDAAKLGSTPFIQGLQTKPSSGRSVLAWRNSLIPDVFSLRSQFSKPIPPFLRPPTIC